MKLKDLEKFAVETDLVPGNSGRTATRVTVLGDAFHPESGRQSQQHTITMSARGKDEKESLEKALERSLSVLDKVKGKAFAVRGGVVQIVYDKETTLYTAKAQLALLDEGDNFTHPVIKSMSAFASNKNPDKAEDTALQTVLEFMGEA